ncbi:MAG: hypothetical protein CSA72_10610 [Rhodobacterales bacterium]|nr:MAG: hypothetical protein CSA72_10610 [Rhodobacterales bacterium]
MDFRNARWADVAQTLINVEIEKDGAWVVTTAAVDDPGTAELFAAAQAAGVADYQRRQPTGADVNEERARRLAQGKSFTVSWQDDPIPMTGRPFDQRTILGLLQRATAYHVQGIDAALITYRDAANVIHHLTPAQFIELAQLGMNWVEAVMDVSWTMKDRGIPFDYDADPRWP